jgi:integrase
MIVAVAVYIIKRKLRGKHAKGAHHHYSLRWRDPASGRQESEGTGTADLKEAKELRAVKYAELNGFIEPEPEPEPEPIKPTWQDCRDALERAMLADNLRPSYVADAVLMLDSLKATFPNFVSPADITADDANEYKRRRGEQGLSAWTIKGDLNTLKAIFGKWLGQECGLLSVNPFANIRAPKCDDPEIRLVTAAETAELFEWLNKRWNKWRLPIVYLEVASLIGWRATEIASLRTADLLDDGFVRVMAESSKTRRQKYGWLPTSLHAELKECSAGGSAFGRFSDELRRRLLLWRKQPHHAAKIKDFNPARLVGWLQDELQRFNEGKAEAAAKADPPEEWQPFTLHDFRRTAISGMQMAGVTEKEASVMVGATPEVMRRHYEKLDQQAIARRNVQRRLGADAVHTLRLSNAGHKSVDPLLTPKESKKVS